MNDGTYWDGEERLLMPAILSAFSRDVNRDDGWEIRFSVGLWLGLHEVVGRRDYGEVVCNEQN